MRRQHVTERRMRGRGDTDRAAGAVDANVRERMLAGVGVRDSRSQGRDTRAPEETATRRHLEGAEQGPA